MSTSPGNPGARNEAGAPRARRGWGGRHLRGTLFAVALLRVACGASLALAQQLDHDLWETNAQVHAVLQSGGTIYVGGHFTYVGPHTGSGVPLDAMSAAPLGGYPEVAGGYVYAALPDGAGGWYIGGTFTRVGSVARNRLAHILADNSVSAWDPGANGAVSALALSGGTLYAGGDFTSIGAQARDRIAALDATTGLATAWDPGADSSVAALAVSGSAVYAGGAFANIGGQARNRIAALDAATGLATAWNPGADGRNLAALAVSGSVVYAGGDFANIGGQARNRVAALDAATGLATAWNPNANGVVDALLASGGVLYAGGSFSNIGGQARSALAALDPATGLATAWNPAVPGGARPARALAMTGNTLYVGGGNIFDGGIHENPCVTAFDATTGQASAWRPLANGPVYALAASGNTVYAGGWFTSIGGVAREYIAALDAITGQATAWNPGLLGTYYGGVFTLAAWGNLVYVGGLFDFGGYPVPTHRNLVAVDATTAQVAAWSPKPYSGFGGYAVEALAVSGDFLYVGGEFVKFAGQTRKGIVQVDLATGLLTAWNPGSDGPVAALATSGNTVYAMGPFGTIGGQARRGLAALDATTGLATAWNPGAKVSNLNGPPPGAALAVSGGLVYAAGDFDSIGGQARRAIAALDATTGLLTAWNPDASRAPYAPSVYALASSGSTVYAGGYFSSIGGLARDDLAALDAATGQATPWDPDPAGNPDVYSSGIILVVAPCGNTVYVGGDFNRICGQDRSYLARVTADEPVPVQVSLVSARAENGRVCLSWFAADGHTLAAKVYRRTAASDWQAIGSISADGTGTLAYEDARIIAGTRYGYRLGVGTGVQESFLGEAWVDVPLVTTFALTGLRPNPAVRELAVAFSLPDASPARLEMLEITGRMVFERQVGSLGAGSHVVNLARDRALPAGVYLLRLTRGGHSLTARGVVIR
jgi:trimeric autotransporter adhesin